MSIENKKKLSNDNQIISKKIVNVMNLYLQVFTMLHNESGKN